MTQCPYPSSKLEWRSDSLDESAPPLVQDAYFDDEMGAWIFSRYADVAAAFRSPALVMSSLKPPTGPVEPLDTVEHDKLVEETRAALSSATLREWIDCVQRAAMERAAELPTNRDVDLMREYAEPLCLLLAVKATHAPADRADELAQLAKQISYATADPGNTKLKQASKAAEAELATYFSSGPKSLRDPGFVGLSQTMSALLANMWLALLQRPEEWQRLHEDSSLLGRAVEELMRYAGLTRVLARRAVSDVTLNGHKIGAGERIFLRVVAANNDPDRFVDPERIDFGRQELGHLSLGAGTHVCVGGPLIRAAAIAITRPLVERFAVARLSAPVEWRGDLVFRAPMDLPVRLIEEKRL